MSNDLNELLGEYLSNLNIAYIDKFRDLVSKSIEDEFEHINSNYEAHKQIHHENLESEYMNFSSIQDDAVFMNDVSHLADELSIVALYKLFEQKHKSLIAFHRKENDKSKHYSRWENVEEALPEEAKNLPTFKSVDELRLVNNAIKHEGVVSKELSKKFPAYGEAGNEFSELDKTFMRLKPCAISYIRELHLIYKSKANS